MRAFFFAVGRVASSRSISCRRWEIVIAELGGTRAHICELAGGDPVWLVLRLYREFLARPDAVESTIEALVYELCAHVAKRSADEFREPVWLLTADAAVREEFVKCSISHRLQRVSACIQPISVAPFAALAVHNMSRAGSDVSLAEVAAEAGFTDQSHMTRIFKRVAGYSPGEHRRLRLMEFLAAVCDTLPMSAESQKSM